jgi:hypothetical protein
LQDRHFSIISGYDGLFVPGFSSAFTQIFQQGLAPFLGLGKRFEGRAADPLQISMPSTARWNCRPSAVIHLPSFIKLSATSGQKRPESGVVIRQDEIEARWTGISS